MENERQGEIPKDIEFQKILEYHPRWFIKWGISVVALIVFAIMISLLFINEPESVSSEFSLYKAIEIAKADSAYFREKSLICAIDLNANDKNKIIHLKKLNLQLIIGIEKYTVSADLADIRYMNQNDKFRIISVIDNSSSEKIRSLPPSSDTIKGKVQIIISDKTLFERFFTNTTP